MRWSEAGYLSQFVLTHALRQVSVSLILGVRQKPKNNTMAIYGAGSNWDGEEVSQTFFANEQFVIGWNRTTASDLQASLASLKLGDIIYLKSNQPGSRSIRVKGIGIVTRSFIECIQSGAYPEGSISEWESFFISVRWIIQEEFRIDIPEDEGRLTNIRAATFYEEPLPFVQTRILDRIFARFNTENAE